MILTETFSATVVDNQDPETRGRIQVTCVGLLGSDEVKYNKWIDPRFDWGWFYVPDIGEEVEIEVVAASDKDQSYGQTFVEAPNPTWRGKREYSSDTPINDEFKTNYGKRRGFATPAGHVFIFDDTEGSEKISISLKDGNIRFDITPDSIQLGEGATEPVILGALFKTTYDAHTHSTAMGPSGPPATPLPASNQSTKVFSV
jgi:hypothetical protein